MICIPAIDKTALKAAIFDVDGTLVDSNDLHVEAWREAFAHYGISLERNEVHAQIGKGGDQLIPAFCSKDEVDKFGEALDATDRPREKSGLIFLSVIGIGSCYCFTIPKVAPVPPQGWGNLTRPRVEKFEVAAGGGGASCSRFKTAATTSAP